MQSSAVRGGDRAMFGSPAVAARAAPLASSGARSGAQPRRALGASSSAGRRASFASSSRPRSSSVSARRLVCRVKPGPVENYNAPNWLDLPLRHVVESQQFNRESLSLIFDEVDAMAELREAQRRGDAVMGEGPLRNCVVSTLFYEPSTRTRLSFEAATARLGGTILSTESAGEFSSAAKGETLEDTIRTVEGYADAIVLRHFQAGAAKRAAAAASVPVLNAGDGPGQHPTQSLIDVYTIRKEVGRLEGLKVALVGDLANGRTVRSLAYVLSMYPGLELVFVAPDVVRMKDDIKEYLTSVGVKWSEAEDLAEVAKDVDVLYQTRIQKERFQDRPEDYELAKGKYIVDAKLMQRLNDKAVVLHPLPRVDEITPDVDADPRAAYFRQAKNGLFVRMALLKLCVVGKN